MQPLVHDIIIQGIQKINNLFLVVFFPVSVPMPVPDPRLLRFGTNQGYRRFSSTKIWWNVVFLRLLLGF